MRMEKAVVCDPLFEVWRMEGGVVCVEAVVAAAPVVVGPNRPPGLQ